MADDHEVADALAGRHIAVVGMNYAPEPTGIAPYTAGLAEMLVEAGARVTVVTGIPHYPSWTVPAEYTWRLRAHETHNGVSVIRARHFVPARQNVIGRLWWEASFLANAGLVRLPERPDAVVAASPSLSGPVVARRLAHHHRVPYGVVVQDLVGEATRNAGMQGAGRMSGAAASVEGGALRGAAQVAVVSEGFRAHALAYGVEAERIRVLPNWAHIAAPSRPRAEVRRQLGWGEDVFVALHTGNMGLKQDLGNVVEAARLLAGRRDVLVVLMGDGNQRAALEAQGAGIPGLRFLAPVEGDLYPDVLRAADLLLVNERSSVGDMSLPSKLTSYFSTGSPVLAAVGPDGSCAREIGRTDGGAVRIDAENPRLLADAVLELAADPGRRARMGEAAGAYAHSYLGRGSATQSVRAFVGALLAEAHEPVPAHH
jgi:glycosyltransferase involved in cell wall biosynthesis